MRAQIFAAGLTCIAVAGCAGDAGTRAQVALAVTCDAYATALRDATARYDQLSEAQRQAIDERAQAASLYCDPKSTFDPATVVEPTEQLVREIRAITEGTK